MTTIRPAALEDARRIFELNRDALGYDFAYERTEKRLREILATSYNHILVAEAGGAVIGYVHAACYDCTYAEPLTNILAIAVDPAVQKSGAGRLLMQAVEDWARGNGCAGVRLVSGFNRTDAHGFYEHIGYHLRKEQKNFIKYVQTEDAT